MDAGINKKYSVGFYTLGCKVSQYESEAVEEAFEKAGFRIGAFDEICDFYVINTCTVTAESDRKCRQIIRRANKKNPSAHILVMGCYSQRDGEKVASLSGVSAVIGTDNKLSLVNTTINIIKSIENGEKFDTYMGVTPLIDAKFEPMAITRAPRTRAYVKIEDGCNSKCTYCAIKDARGPIRSKIPCDVISEVEALSKSGTQEIVLTGIEIGSYGKDLAEKYDLGDLITELDKRKSATQIRIGSLAPELISDTFIEKIKNTKILCPHFHISVQSGSDKILSYMKRRYTAKSVLKTIEKLRAVIKNAQFTTDLMVGFPYESEEDFLSTLEFSRKAKFLDAHVFCYSKREGTEACYFDAQIEKAVKEDRSKRLSLEIAKIREKILSDIIDKKEPIKALVETCQNGCYSAHSPSYIELMIREQNPNCDLRGKCVWVLPVSQKNGILECEICK
jgi:threonylcarbamoyladenosine tRNA methylthiotransferase MtaB